MKKQIDPHAPALKTGIEIIAAERERQITAEGCSAAHDAAHIGGEMADAAACYAHVAAIEARGPLTKDHMEIIMDGFGEPTWPWEPEWFKPQGGRLRNLAKAGALIAAEIDRIQREEEKP